MLKLFRARSLDPVAHASTFSQIEQMDDYDRQELLLLLDHLPELKQGLEKLCGAPLTADTIVSTLESYCKQYDLIDKEQPIDNELVNFLAEKLTPLVFFSIGFYEVTNAIGYSAPEFKFISETSFTQLLQDTFSGVTLHKVLTDTSGEFDVAKKKVKPDLTETVRAKNIENIEALMTRANAFFVRYATQACEADESRLLCSYITGAEGYDPIRGITLRITDVGGQIAPHTCQNILDIPLHVLQPENSAPANRHITAVDEEALYQTFEQQMNLLLSDPKGFGKS